MLLPHGLEGQGPEHSSARLERFLQLAADDNIQVAYPTTPAQYFHLLRRQALRSWRKPLIVMTPKSLLRHPQVVSALDECAIGPFHTALADSPGRKPSEIQRLLLCSGKIYYELDHAREEAKRAEVAILRVEQLYPLPFAQLEALLGQYGRGVPVYWVQEEPLNMGAWPYLALQFCSSVCGHPLDVIARPRAATPASGSHHRHKQEQTELIKRAFA
jgi:2-oxoglutarate dehydrogenase E1 component